MTALTAPATDWVEDLKKVKVGYTGEEVKTAEDLTFAQVVKSLPPAEAAASVPAVEIAEGMVAAALKDPKFLMRPSPPGPTSSRQGKSSASPRGGCR